MPAFLEKKLRAEAHKKGFTGDRADKYVYGTMNKMGAMKGSKETKKGEEMERKHQIHIHGASTHDVVEMAEECEVREIDAHQYAPEYRNTAAYRIVKVKKDYDADDAIPDSWDLDEDGDADFDVHGA